MRILLVEDDQKLAGLIERMLQSAHYNVDIAYDGDSGTDLALRGIHEIAIIDWMLPGRDGPSICRAVRSARLPMAILMLTARTQVEDRVGGLDAGADDYLTKPFAMDELLARLRALQRRFTPTTNDPYELRVGSIVMDLHTHSVRRGEHTLELTPKEWTLLEYLLRHANQAVTRTNILDYVWSYEGSVRPDLVDVYVSYLRSKLNLPGKADPIATVRGIGYRLESKYA
jgi:two-component system OmpR family response regulator